MSGTGFFYHRVRKIFNVLLYMDILAGGRLRVTSWLDHLITHIRIGI